MTLRALLAALSVAHAIVTPRGDRLHVSADKGTLAPLTLLIAAHKPELRALVANGQLDCAMREAAAAEAMLAEGWDDPRWTNVDKVLALVDRPRRPVHVIPLRRGGRR